MADDEELRNKAKIIAEATGRSEEQVLEDLYCISVCKFCLVRVTLALMMVFHFGFLNKLRVS